MVEMGGIAPPSEHGRTARLHKLGSFKECPLCIMERTSGHNVSSRAGQRVQRTCARSSLQIMAITPLL